MEIVATEEFAEPVLALVSEVDSILKQDSEPQESEGLSGCEREIYDLLGKEGWTVLLDALAKHLSPAGRDPRGQSRRALAVARARRHGCRCLANAARYNYVTVTVAGRLTNLQGTQRGKYLKWLAADGRLLKALDPDRLPGSGASDAGKGSGQQHRYTLGTAFEARAGHVTVVDGFRRMPRLREPAKAGGPGLMKAGIALIKRRTFVAVVSSKVRPPDLGEVKLIRV